ncbi:MAG: MHS family MFS transporter [Ignavibacteriaceae bacterium]|nr:MHS family MFS transporter [Ignavibacteriaceae bacterium]
MDQSTGTSQNEFYELEKPESLTKVIVASSVGTMIEWYDFYIFGSLATVIAGKFYQTGTALGDIIAWLAAFAVGFIVRPFGALFFGRIGDLIGRKYTFLITMSLMGLCTFAVGLLPTTETIGPAAGIILIVLRILQGLALGGEYGGAATYIAEHSPNGKRGYYTSFIQITATAGLFMSLGVILLTRQFTGEEAFADYGWRIPFLISIVLVAVSLYIRVSLKESPLFNKLKKEGKISKNPLKESFANKENLRMVMLALFGATMGQGVVWYTGQFYALFYLQKIFNVPLVDSNMIVGGALLVASPLFVVTGWLSDRVGRKPIILGGMLAAALTYIPIYTIMEHFRPGPEYNPYMLSFLVFIQVVYVTMVYGPIAAFLVELFPTKIRYTSMSLPYHIGNGVIGGLVPIIGLTLIEATGNHLAGLWYPIAIAAISFIVGYFFIPETRHIELDDTHL